MGLTSKRVPRFLRYQETTMSWPSGLSVGHNTRITLSRMVSTSGSPWAEASLYASAIECCPPATSLECRPPSMCTMTFDVWARSLACASVRSCAVASFLSDRLVFVEAREILWRRDHGNFDVAPLGRLAYREHLHAIGVRRKLVEVVNLLFVIGQVVVVAGRVAQN